MLHFFSTYIPLSLNNFFKKHIYTHNFFFIFTCTKKNKNKKIIIIYTNRSFLKLFSLKKKQQQTERSKYYKYIAKEEKRLRRVLCGDVVDRI